MRTALFDFELPPDRIALRPVSPRDAARLLIVRPGSTPELEDRGVHDLPELLRAGDALVVNDTKVIAARLRGRRIGRGAMEPSIEATLHQRLDGSRWRAFVKPAKRLSPGDVVRFGDDGKVCFLGQLDATVEAKGEGGEVTLAFAFHGPVLDQAVDERGTMPLPPYIRRAPGGIALHRRAHVISDGAGNYIAQGHAACRGRDVPPCQDSRHGHASYARGGRERHGADGGCAQPGAVGGRPHRRSGLD